MNQSKNNLDKFVSIFIDYLTIKNFSKDTIKTYRSCIEKFKTYMLKNRYDFTNKLHIKGFLSYIYMNVSKKTYEKYVAILKSFYNFLNSEGYIDSNPLKIRLKWSSKVLKDIPNEDVIKKIMGLSGDDRIIFILLYGCGLRISEAANLNVGDINFYDGTIRVFGKGGRERIVPVPDKIMSMIMEYVRNMGLRSVDPLILNIKNERLTQSGMRKRVVKLMKKLGLSYTPHKFRHAYATHILKRGAPIRVVQELLGHKSIASTQIYTKVEMDKIIQEYKKAF
ncbi:MAG: tyrosine-type recombinase/integrase [bacterium]|nr:tyrosine-type recombinase/integrase [bacterium]